MTSFNDLVDELLVIGRQVKDPSYSASGFLGKDDSGKLVKSEAAQEIGEILNNAGGIQAMRSAYETVRTQLGSGAARELEVIWNGIGLWRS